MIFLKKFKEKLIKEAIAATKEGLILDSQIDIVSNSCITIQGCYGILEYAEEYVRVKLKNTSVVFYGNGLRIENLSDDRIEIKGSISQIEYL